MLVNQRILTPRHHLWPCFNMGDPTASSNWR